MNKPDEELYRRMRLGEREAFAELYVRWEPALFRYALHASGSISIAEDIANEVFVQLMSSSSRFDETKGSLEGWLFGVARNLVRTARRRGPTLEPVDQPFRPDVLGGLIQGEKTSALHDAVRELPEHYRDVVILCDLEERNYDEVAGLLGCPIGTVRSRLHRARAALAGKLKWLNAMPVEGVSNVH